jgi:hypothetical protein
VTLCACCDFCFYCCCYAELVLLSRPVFHIHAVLVFEQVHVKDKHWFQQQLELQLQLARYCYSLGQIDHGLQHHR